ncbi:MAG: hypothetical protein FK732_11145 [Asgard group archaeon]|nr:hypothetical protein [Asgard group archaeon]
MKEKKRGNTEEKLRHLTKRLEELESRLEKENLLVDELRKEIRLLRNISLISTSILKTASYVTRYKYGDMSRHIVETLTKVGPMNVSQLTEFLRKIRGTASRRIVADRIRLLKEHGIIEEIPGKKSEKRYIIKEKRKED